MGAEFEVEIALHVRAEIVFFHFVVVAEYGLDAQAVDAAVVQVQRIDSGIEVRACPGGDASGRETESATEFRKHAVAVDRRRDRKHTFDVRGGAVRTTQFGRLENVVLPLRPELQLERVVGNPLEVERRGLVTVDRALRAQTDLRQGPDTAIGNGSLTGNVCRSVGDERQTAVFAV